MTLKSEKIAKFSTLPIETKFQYLKYFLSHNNNIYYFLGNTTSKFKLLFNNIKYDKNLKIIGGIIIDIFPESEVKIGKDVTIISNAKRCSASTLYSKSKIKTFSKSSYISIGDGTGLNGTSITSRSKKIIIGKNCMLAPNIIITDSDFHIPWPPEKRNFYPGNENDEDVTIGDNCWIGMNSIVLKGVKIGDNSVIGAGSLIDKEIPSDCLAAGCPAKVIKYYK